MKKSASSRETSKKGNKISKFLVETSSDQLSLSMDSSERVDEKPISPSKKYKTKKKSTEREKPIVDTKEANKLHHRKTSSKALSPLFTNSSSLALEKELRGSKESEIEELKNRKTKVNDIAGKFKGESKQETLESSYKRLMDQEKSYRKKVMDNMQVLHSGSKEAAKYDFGNFHTILNPDEKEKFIRKWFQDKKESGQDINQEDLLSFIKSGMNPSDSLSSWEAPVRKVFGIPPGAPGAAVWDSPNISTSNKKNS